MWLRAWALSLAAVVGLVAPGAAEAGADAAPVWCHVVRRGESLATIARRAGTTPAQLRRLNALGQDSSARPGDILLLPAGHELRHARLAALAAPIPASRGHLRRENARADADRLSRVRARRDLERFVRAGLLVPVPEAGPGFRVGDVPPWRRVARPWARLFLEHLGQAVHVLFDGRLRVTDLTRTEAVQAALAEWNGNAAPARGPVASTHLTGAAIDLSKVEHSDAEIAWLRLVLTRLSRQGLVTAIEEFAQPHFHVLVHRAYADHGARLRSPVALGGC
jgi:murein DD-endopeptidase MepM/ murein hydrolase activator NlpD